MGKQSRWVKRHIECPEGKGENDLLIEFQDDRGKEVVRAISCHNPLLEDFAGGTCGWSCWQEVREE